METLTKFIRTPTFRVPGVGSIGVWRDGPRLRASASVVSIYQRTRRDARVGQVHFRTSDHGPTFGEYLRHLQYLYHRTLPRRAVYRLARETFLGGTPPHPKNSGLTVLPLCQRQQCWIHYGPIST